MQFKVGDFVVHPVYGVGLIVKIAEKRLSEMEAPLYYEITLPRRTVWIPVKAQAAIGLRLVTAKRDLDQYRALLKSPPVPLDNAQPQRRHEELSRRLKQGTFPVMCEIVRDLTASAWQRPLGATAKAILKKAEEKLYQEWATAAEISIAEAMKEVETLLQATQAPAPK